MLDPKIIRTRLAFIRYIYGLGVDQSRQPDPQRAASILTLHDAVELFLQLALEHSGVTTPGKKDVGFLEYWDHLATAVPPYNLTAKASMARLNRARVSLKHHGLLPSPGDVEALRSSVTSFFEDNCTPVFEVDFDRISMVDLVASPEVRERLVQADDLISKGDYKAALRHMAHAFWIVVDKCDVVGDLTLGRLFVPPSLASMGSPEYFEKAREEDEKRWIIEAIERLSSAVRVMALGLDYQRFERFRRITPLVTRLMGGDYVVDERHWEEDPREEECREALEFVIDSALRVEQRERGRQ